MRSAQIKPVLAMFDPRARGAGEADWAGLFAKQPSWSPREGPLVVVAPHPDDEVVAAGGLIHAWVARGAQVSVLSVSDGEAADPKHKRLALVRREELMQALRKLCPTHVSVTRLGLPDGGIARYLNRVRNALSSLRSGQSTLISPYEHDGHPDHDAVGGMCLEFARANDIPIARYAIRAWERAIPEALRSAGWVRFVLTEEARRAKARALECFRSRRHPAPGHCERSFEPFLV